MDVRMPDGTIVTNVPEGVTQEELMARLNGGPVAGTGSRVVNGIIRGVRDIPDAGAQLVTRSLEAVAPAGSRFEAWARGEREKVEAINKRAEEDYQQNWRRDSGIDWGRMGGNVLATAPLAGIGTAGNAGRLANALRSGANAAATTAVSQPVYDTEQGFWSEKGKQAGIGAVVPAAMGAASSAVRGVQRPEVQALLREGVTPTTGQILGGAANAMEQKAMSIPIVGDVIGSGRRAALQDFNRAALNRTVEPLWQEAGRVGRGGVDDVSQALNDAYERIKPQMVVQRDQPFDAAVNRVRTMLGSVQGAEQQTRELERVIDRDMLGRFTQAGRMGGEELKRVQQDLRVALEGAQRRANGGTAFDRDLVNALREVREQFNGLVQRGNPGLADDLAGIDRGYANLARVQQAAASPGARDGIFTPAQLAQAVRSGDNSVRKNAYARGNAFMQDLTDAGRNVLDSTVPDSGTTGRALAAFLMGGGVGAVNPMLAAPAAMYAPGGRQLMATLLARRPQSAQALADAIAQSGQYLAPASAPLLLGNP